MYTIQLPKRLQRFLEQHAVKIELLVLFVVIICLMIYYYTGSSGLPFLLSLTFAAILYFTFALMHLEESGLAKIAHQVMQLGSSIAALGILYNLYNYPGSEIMLELGTVAMVLALVVFLISNKGDWTLWRKVIIIRITLMATLVLALLYLI